MAAVACQRQQTKTWSRTAMTAHTSDTRLFRIQGEVTMASSSGKPTAVHFSLVVFVMLTIIASVVAYISHKDSSETRTKLTTATEDLTKQKTLAGNYLDSITALKKRLGPGFEEVGDEETPNTLLWAVAEDIRILGSYPQDMPVNQLPNVHDAFIKLRADLDRSQSEYNAKDVELRDRNVAFTAVETIQQARVDTAKQAQSTAETLRDEVQQQQRERLKTVEDSRDEIARQLAQEKNAHELTLETTGKQIASLRQENNDLIVINERFKKKLDDAEKPTFEVADGEIRWVDHVSRLVWINVGSDDGLTKRTTFSVYKKAHHGIGGGTEDIKGSIQVIRIIDAHLAEARVLSTDIYQPIAPGDPIYTPLWSPGRSEFFSFAGFIDLDGDGHSDRELLHGLIAAAGGKVDNYVDDEGQRFHLDKLVTEDSVPRNQEINVQTKFLVVGRLPDPTSTADEEEKKTFFRILGHFEAMEKEARKQGVRQINLGDFLSYIGYKPSRRLWHPGEGSPYKLKSGSRSTATRLTIGNRESSGQTAGIYSRSKRLKQPKSTGQTSKAFRGGSKSGY
jgi:hypothetical protein